MKGCIYLLLTLLFLSSTNAYASNITSVSNTNNDIESTIEIKTYKDNSEIFYVGDQLNLYKITINSTKNGSKVRTIGSWDDKNYKIKEGLQTVKINVKAMYEDNYSIYVDIIGISKSSKDDALEIVETYSNSETLTATTLLLSTGSSYDINLYDAVEGSTYKWSSSNTKVAKVNSKGLVTSLSKGNAIITCQITNGNTVKKLNANVIVDDIGKDIVLSDNDLDLDIGDKYTLKVENNIVGSTVKFTSSDKTIAKVGTTSGKVTAIKKGDAIITCTVTTPNKEVYVLKCNVIVE